MGAISYTNTVSDHTCPLLKLCKPDRTVISPLKEIYGLSLTIRLGAINEISFTIPTKIERQHILIDNPLIDLIKDRYYLKMTYNNQVEYFLFLDKNKQVGNDGNSISYTAYSCGIELADKNIRDYEETSKTLSEYVNFFLAETEWKLDYVDAAFNLKYRSFDVSSATVLQCLFDIAERFNALIVWDTKNRKVNLHQPNHIGMNRGVRLKEGILLDSLSVAIKAEDMVTRLKAYGQDGLEFRTLSPTGSNYLEDFSYFMYPFECDTNYNVIKQSDYMSNQLCIALTKYKRKLQSFQGQFDSLVAQKKTKQDYIQQEEQELSNLETQLKTYLNERDVINYTYQDQAPGRADWLNVISRINAKQNEINNKNSQIATLNIQLMNIEQQMSDLGLQLKMEHNFSPEEITELNKYIIVKEHHNDSITDEKDLLEEAKEIFKTLNEPPIHVNVGLEGYLSNLHETMSMKQIAIGDIIRVQNDELRVRLTLKIIEMQFDFNNDSVNLTIANGKDVVDENGKLKKVIYDISNTSTTVNMDKYKWNQGKDAMDGVTQILNSEFDTAKNILIGGYANSTTMNERGLYSKDLQDDKTYLVINNALMAITPDGGNSIAVAISKRGVHAEVIAGRLLLGNKLHIEDELGIVTIYNGLQSVYDTNGKIKVHLGRYPHPDSPSQYKYGLRVYDGAIDIRSSSNAYRGTQLDGSGFRAFNNNGVRTFNVDATTGQVEIIGDLTIKSSPSSYRGVVITSSGITGYNASGGVTFELNANSGRMTSQENFLIQSSTSPNRGVKMDDYGIRGYSTNGTRTFEIDTYGNAFFSGNISASTISGTTINGTTINGGNISGTTVSASSIHGGSINATTINGGTITGTIINGNTINGGTINGTKINSADININEDVRIGNRLYLNDTSGSGIYFNRIGSTGKIYSNGNHLTIYSDTLVIDSMNSTSFYNNVDFTNATSINGVARGHTSGIGIAYSSASNFLYVRINGTNVGYVKLT
ncbi:phage tail protein [Lysinibacillus pakistanensis]|uniref:phage tail protein n=1 Tax=Lysinibacillus pakistanensis TaxID=759811 RepID=UPI003D2DC7E2